MKLWSSIAWGLLLMAGSFACESPSDVIVEPPSFTPLQDQAGRYRVTFGPGPDAVRGFLPDGRLLFRTYDLAPFGKDWILASVPLDSGVVREEVAAYRPALLHPVGTLTSDGALRVLGAWHVAAPGLDGCPDSSVTSAGTPGPAPRTPSPVAITLYTLPATDGTPLASLPRRFVSIPTVTGRGTTQQRVRVGPAVRDADERGANPFGPVLLAGSVEAIISDGEQIWQASLTDTSAPPVLIGTGAYPAVSADGRLLAFARPLGLDSIVTTFSIPLGFLSCNEEHVEVTATSWEIVVRNLESGAEQVLTEGRDPAFAPAGDRLVVRGPDLRWVDLASSVITPIVGTTGGFAPAINGDGTVLAFSLVNPDTDADVYFLRLVR
ncbi:MAG: hypothetical protein OEW56_00340 [Gemmatimonadota bacterium]|nr:hypothetical protein [Gemmatimonadota bacterium]